MKSISLLAALAVSFWGVVNPSAVSAGSCKYGVCWGAIGVGERGISARASNRNTGPGAMARVEKVCRGKCQVVEVFHSGCGAIVSGSDGTIFAGFGESRDGAIAQAKGVCTSYKDQACRTRVWACSN